MKDNQVEILPNAGYAIKKIAINSLILMMPMFVLIVFAIAYVMISLSMPINVFLSNLSNSLIYKPILVLIAVLIGWYVFQFISCYSLLKKSKIKIILSTNGITMVYGKLNKFLDRNNYKGISTGLIAFTNAGKIINKFKKQEIFIISNLFEKNEIEEKINNFRSNN